MRDEQDKRAKESRNKREQIEAASKNYQKDGDLSHPYTFSAQ